MRITQDNRYAEEYRKFTFWMAAGAILSIIFVVVFSYAVIMITAHMTYDATISVKKNMLKENVDNLIAFIDTCAEKFEEQHSDAGEAGLEEAMQDIARDKIYSETHVDGTYMWVQKVLDYEGGDDYAIRLIHPNLSNTEGSYLSTNAVNPDGSRPYEEELEGVKNNGSVFLKYDFKKLDSDEITEKVTYSKLYKRFDWIVCMGVNMDDMDYYQQQALNKMILPQTLILLVSSASWLGILFLMFRAYRKTRGKILEKKNEELSNRLDWDAVSTAGSRIRGQRFLDQAFLDCTNGKKDMLLLMLDVDFFKQFNDNYGHEIGDKVLKSFVEAVKENLDEKDEVFRWGGDEFIAILNEVPKEDQPRLGDEILASIRNIVIPELNGERGITASMGFTYFDPSDETVNDTLKRADAAVYEAKENGRNNWKIK